MKFNLAYTQRAIRDVRKLEPPIKLRIGKALLRFQEDPMKYAEKIADPKLGSYRFRIGDYRVIFDLEGEEIVILRIGHRRDIYRR
ncbi:MAG: type II toxin-antitoxin system RelE/ParE family toxin [Deltaproteobacteria bacterium]|nr:type II toxin-antitoxin system RelE/ParE family toxin [Deltaproteobacteria bacterium]